MATLTDVFGAESRLLIRQIKEWGEILTGFETKNRYGIYDTGGRELGFIAEESGLAGRFFLAQMRACTLHVFDQARREVARIEKPFTFWLHEMKLVDDGRVIGEVERQFAVLTRRFVVRNAQGATVAEIVSPLLRIWTFKVLVNEREVAVISKEWGGLLKEAFTKADTFGVEFKARISDDLRKLLLAATMLIDFCHFEQKN